MVCCQETLQPFNCETQSHGYWPPTKWPESSKSRYLLNFMFSSVLCYSKNSKILTNKENPTIQTQHF